MNARSATVRNASRNAVGCLHVKFLDLQHGDIVCDVTAVETPDAAVQTIASFVIEDGTPGAVRA